MSKFINTADLHCTLNRPRCRVDDDWMLAQGNVLRFILGKAREYECPLVINGDIFDTSVSGVELVNWLLGIFLEYPDVLVYAIPGNHDLPYHNLENIDRSAYGVLQKSGLIKTDANMFPFGTDTVETVLGMETVFIHRLVMEKDPGFRMGNMITAGDLLSQYTDAKWIFTGDNHEGFAFVKDGRYVINPGSPMRLSADQKDYTPRIYFVDTDTELFEEIEVPDPVDMVVTDYLQKDKDRDQRIQEFVGKMKNTSPGQGIEGIGYSFEDNLKRHYVTAAKNGVDISDDVKDLISEVMI